MEQNPEIPIIQGEKIWLRAMERRDLPVFAKGRNDLEIGYEAGYQFPTAMTNLESWYQNIMSNSYGKDGFYFTICRLGSDQLVGFAWLWHVNYIDCNAEFSIFLTGTDIMNKGLGTDALRAILSFGFENLPLERIYLQVRASNKRAIRSYEKAGMSLEGTLRKSKRFRGKLVDDVVMAILREEWKAG